MRFQCSSRRGAWIHSGVASIASIPLARCAGKGPTHLSNTLSSFGRIVVRRASILLVKVVESPGHRVASAMLIRSQCGHVLSAPVVRRLSGHSGSLGASGETESQRSASAERGRKKRKMAARLSTKYEVVSTKYNVLISKYQILSTKY